MRVGLAGAGRIGAMHAEILSRLERVDELVVADADPARAASVAAKVGARTVPEVDALFTADLDAIVIAAATDAHPRLIEASVAAGIPTFCEKPVAPDVTGTLAVIEAVDGSGVPVQIGFQRRFDAGYRAARDAVRSGELGWLHTVRSTTLDPAPPPPLYVQQSGSIFVDCAVHDFDSIRWATGREVVSVFATGTNKGAPFFTEYGDVDTGVAVLVLDDDTLATVDVTRYNAAGYDIRLELLGADGSVSTGLDDQTPLRSTEPGVTFPAGPAYTAFPERFADAYAAELTAFLDVAASGGTPECTPRDALEAFYVAEACERSWHEGRVVRLEEVRR